jgi:hypothetical protein
MRINQHPFTRRRFAALRRQSWGRLFGAFLRDARLERGRSVEDAAGAAGMEVGEWEAVEAGQVPNGALICRMADALGVDRMGIASLVLFCHEAWG